MPKYDVTVRYTETVHVIVEAEDGGEAHTIVNEMIKDFEIEFDGGEGDTEIANIEEIGESDDA